MPEVESCCFFTVQLCCWTEMPLSDTPGGRYSLFFPGRYLRYAVVKAVPWEAFAELFPAVLGIQLLHPFSPVSRAREVRRVRY